MLLADCPEGQLPSLIMNDLLERFCAYFLMITLS